MTNQYGKEICKILLTLAISTMAWTGLALADAMPPVSGVISVATEPVTIKTTSVEGKVSNRTVGVGQPIYLNDEIKTGPNNKLQILLKDQTVFNIGPNSVMTIDKFVFDPTKGELSVGIQKGAFKFVSGKVSNSNPDAMKVKLPNATISVRGTGVAGNVAPDGASTVVLLHGVVDVAGTAGTSTLSKSGWGVQVAPGGVVGQPAITPPEVVKNIMGAVAQIKAPVSTPVAANAATTPSTSATATSTSPSSASTTTTSSSSSSAVGVQTTSTDSASKSTTTTSTTSSSSSSSSASSIASIYAMPNNEAAKDAAGIVSTNSLQSSLTSSTTASSTTSGMSADLTGNFSTKVGATSAAATATDISTTKATVASTTSTTATTYTPSIIPASYVNYLKTAGINTTNLDLNTVDLNSDLGKALIKAKQEYEISTGTAPTTGSTSSSSSGEPFTDTVLIENYLSTNYASDYTANKFNASTQLTTIANNLESLRTQLSANGELDFTNYSAFRTAYTGPAGSIIFGFDAARAMTCVSSGNSCGSGASTTLNSHRVTLNFLTNQITNAYSVTYSLGGPGSGAAVSSGTYASSETVNMASLQAYAGSKIFYLPTNASHTLLKMLASFTAPTAVNQSSTGVFNTAIQKQIGTNSAITMSTGSYSATQSMK